jgi:hypothetical protein
VRGEKGGEMEAIRGDCESCGRKGILIKEIVNGKKTKKVCIYGYRILGKRRVWVQRESCFEAFYKPHGWKEK